MADHDLLSRLETWARRHPLRLRGLQLNLLAVRIARRFLDVRITGLAAEMTYYALLSIFPLIGALGASLGFVERLVGTGAAEKAQAAIVVALGTVFRTEVTADVLAPMVQGLLQQERTGFAVGGLLVSLFLASRVFRSAIHTLDQAYGIEEGRGTVELWGLGFLFSIGAVVTAVTLLGMVVVGPLLGGGRAIAEGLGLGAAFELVWALARWPVVFGVAVGYLTVLYHDGPNVENTWGECLPGAVFGMVALVVVSLGFRVYLGATGLESPEIRDAEEAVSIAAQVIGAVLAALLWLWLSGMSILTGAVVNAEVSRLRREDPPRNPSPSGTSPRPPAAPS